MAIPVDKLVPEKFREEMAGKIPVAVVIAVEYFDPDDGESSLWWCHDSDVGLWRHLGMVEIVANDIRNDHLRAAREVDED